MAYNAQNDAELLGFKTASGKNKRAGGDNILPANVIVNEGFKTASGKNKRAG